MKTIWYKNYKISVTPKKNQKTCSVKITKELSTRGELLIKYLHSNVTQEDIERSIEKAKAYIDQLIASIETTKNRIENLMKESEAGNENLI